MIFFLLIRGTRKIRMKKLKNEFFLKQMDTKYETDVGHMLQKIVVIVKIHTFSCFKDDLLKIKINWVTNFHIFSKDFLPFFMVKI